MGKKQKKEKKGKGAEKTAKKTDKKMEKKVKKALAEAGEEDIEALIAEFQSKDKKRLQVVEEKCDPPSPRCNMTLTSHPDKEELIMFGGEYFNGSKTFMYNELYFYNIKKNEWLKVTAPNAPPPRCSHQAVALKQGGGQLWLFGGEFASPTQSQFYHYKDLWVYHLQEKKWEKVNAPGGPSSRSGHRMTSLKKLLIVFGGFHDNIRDYKYFNDAYAFNLETYTWMKVEASGIPPAPRSGCQMAALAEQNKLLIYGGYSKEKVKKEVDKGTIHSDMFYLVAEDKKKDDLSTVKWKWQSVKQSGTRPSPRCGFSLTPIGNNKAITFGGVYDEEDSEEEIKGVFYNEMYTLELDTGKWYDLVLRGKKVITEKKKRRRKDKKTQDGENEEGDCDEEGEEEEEEEEDMDVEEEVKNLKIEGNKTDSTESSSSPQNEETTYDDGVFKVTVGPQTTSQSGDVAGDSGSTCMEADIFIPRPRMNAIVTVKNNQLFLYGGLYEEGDKQITLDDMYSLDVQKLEEWNIICKGNVDSQEWQESDSSSDEEEDEDMVSEGTGEDLDLEDAPEIEEEEELTDYFLRTREFWLETASDMLADEAEGMSSGKMRQKAEEIAELYYKSNT